MDWKANPVTKALFSHMEKRILDVCLELGNHAGNDPSWDRFKVGYIQAYRDILEIEVDDVGGTDGD